TRQDLRYPPLGLLSPRRPTLSRQPEQWRPLPDSASLLHSPRRYGTQLGDRPSLPAVRLRRVLAFEDARARALVEPHRRRRIHALRIHPFEREPAEPAAGDAAHRVPSPLLPPLL